MEGGLRAQRGGHVVGLEVEGMARGHDYMKLRLGGYGLFLRFGSSMIA